MDKPANYHTKKWTLFGLTILSIVQMIVLGVVIYVIAQNAINDRFQKELILIAALVTIFTAMVNVIGLISSLLKVTWLILTFIVLNCITGLLFFVLSCGVPHFWGIAATSIATSVVGIGFYRDVKTIASNRAFDNEKYH